MKRLVILGAGGHGRVAADIAGKNGYDSIAFLDDTKKTCGRYPVMGESARFSEYDCDFFVAIGNPQVRRRMQEMLLTAGKQVTTLIHPSAVIGEDVALGTGTLVAAGIAAVLRDEALRQKLTENTKIRDYTNAGEIEKIYRLLENV